MNLLADHGWIAWIIIGGLAGVIAKAIMPGRDPQGCIVTILPASPAGSAISSAGIATAKARASSPRS